MPISKVGVQIGNVAFHSSNVSFSLNTHRDSTGMPILQNLQTTVTVQVDMYDKANLPFEKIKSLFELAKLPNGSNIREVDINFWSDDAGTDSICSYHFKGWITRFETYTAPGSNGILALELCPIINDQTGSNVTIDRE
jgi:hypothetical protein